MPRLTKKWQQSATSFLVSVCFLSTDFYKIFHCLGTRATQSLSLGKRGWIYYISHQSK